jgi:hypothetical protein
VGSLGGKAVSRTGALLAMPLNRLRGTKTPPDDGNDADLER